MTNELQLLSDWLNSPAESFAWEHVCRLSPYWREEQYFTPSREELGTAKCRCDFNHATEVIYGEDGSPAIICPLTGCMRKVKREELRLWLFNGGRMAAELSRLFECKGEPSVLVSGLLWRLGMTSHRIGGIPRNVYFALRLTGDALARFQALPKDSSQAVLISAGNILRQPEGFRTDNIFSLADIAEFTGQALALNLEAMNLRLGNLVAQPEKKGDAGDKDKHVGKLKEELNEELKDAYDFYCNGEGRKGRKWSRLTMQRLADKMKCAKSTVSKILSRKNKDSGKKEHKEIFFMWEATQTYNGIMKYGDSNFKSISHGER